MKKYKYLYLLLLLIFLFILKLNLFPKAKHNSALNNGLMSVHYIDIGQGDAILVTVNSKTLLIDSGPKSSRNQIINYLDELHITKFDYLIATHPHEDHIGNMSYIIKKYEIGSFFSPKIISNSKSFESMVQSLIEENMKINIISPLTQNIDLGPETSINFFTPSQPYSKDNLNLYSPIMKISYKNISFLFTGDAEKINEEEVLNSNISLKSDVLKLGHHGSSTSTSEDFFNAVSPSVVVISVGKDNSYNHPSKSVLNFLKQQPTPILRTDNLGTIVISTDGEKLSSFFPDK